MVKDMDVTVVFPVVKKVLDKHDIETLLKHGFGSADEYDLESLKVMDAIHREGPVTKNGLARIIRLVFHYSYHSWTMEDMDPIKHFMPMAKELWEALPANCRE